MRRRGCAQTAGFSPAFVARRGGPWPVGRQVEHRQRATEVAAPVVEVSVEHLLREPLTLPAREVGELNRYRRQAGRPPGDAGIVERDQLSPQDPERPVVADDVMHVDQEHVVGGVETDQVGPDDRPLGQIEGAASLRSQDVARSRSALRLRFGLKIHDRQVDVALGDPLHRSAVHRRKHRSQNLVPAEDGVKRRGQCIGIQPAPYTHGCRRVVGRAVGRQSVQEPRALLRERKRSRIMVDLRCDRRSTGGATFADGVGEAPCQSGDGWSLEHVA